MSGHTHVLMLLANSFLPDPRVHKEARSLLGDDFDVTVVCMDRAGDLPIEAEVDGIRVRRIRVGKVRPGEAGSVGPALLRFYARALSVILRLHREKPFGVVHCHDFDTMLLGTAVKLKLHIPLVYDMHDLYSSFFRSAAAERAVQLVDRAFYRYADGQIVVNDSFLSLPGIELDKTVVIMNVPERTGAHISTETRNGLFYAGNLDALRDMRYAIDVLRACDLPVQFAGDGPLLEEYRKMEPDSNIKLLGRISPVEVFERTRDCLAVLALYDTAYRNNCYASPNKLFDAMKYGKPAIVSDGTVMADIVRKYDCGLPVAYGDARALGAAIDQLLDPARYRQLCANAHRAFLDAFNWDIMADRLRDLYRRLARAN